MSPFECKFHVDNIDNSNINDCVVLFVSRLFLARGADVEAKNNKNETPLEVGTFTACNDIHDGLLSSAESSKLALTPPKKSCV